MIPAFHGLSQILLIIIRLFIGVTFLWAGLAKIPEPGLFAQTIRAYNVLSQPLINPFAISVPWIEVFAGTFLILGLWVRSSAIVCLTLLMSFTMALGINVYRGVDLSCGCFALDGTGASLNEAMARNLILIAVVFILTFVRNVPVSIDSLLKQRQYFRLESAHKI